MKPNRSFEEDLTRAGVKFERGWEIPGPSPRVPWLTCYLVHAQPIKMFIVETFDDGKIGLFVNILNKTTYNEVMSSLREPNQ